MAARARGASSPATASPRSDAYTGILGISLAAMIGAVVLLFMDWNQYPDSKPPKVPSGPVGGAAAPPPPVVPAAPEGGVPPAPGAGGAPAPAPVPPKQ